MNRIRETISLVLAALRGEELNFTEGGINRAIFMLSLPMILEMAMESLFAVVDIYFVGRLQDSHAVAAVGLTESTLALLYSLAWGLSAGATALVSRRVGEKDFKGASVAAVQVLYAGAGISLVLSLVGLFFHKDLLRLMGASSEVIAVGSGYTAWMWVGNASVMFLFLINAVFRGAGNAAIAMRSLWLANIINMVLDPLLIFGWGSIPAMGVEGAAIATNIGRSVGVLYQLYFLFNGGSLIKLAFDKLKPDFRVMMSLITLSAGGTMQNIIASASWVFLARIMAGFGSSAVAGYTIAIRVIIFTILPSWGMANAAATLVGQNLGAGKPERAEQSVWKAGFYNMVFLFLIMFVFLFLSEPILLFFTNDLSSIQYGTRCLQIVSLGYAFYGYGMILSQAFNGAGDTRTPLYLNLFGYWFFQVPLAYVLAYQTFLQSNGVFAAIAIAESAVAVAAIFLFRRGKWKQVKV
ncbi:MAG: MATE family efflux transporter [Cyclobacteriaceae bacterium]